MYYFILRPFFSTCSTSLNSRVGRAVCRAGNHPMGAAWPLVGPPGSYAQAGSGLSSSFATLDSTKEGRQGTSEAQTNPECLRCLREVLASALPTGLAGSGSEGPWPPPSCSHTTPPAPWGGGTQGECWGSPVHSAKGNTGWAGSLNTWTTVLKGIHLRLWARGTELRP